MLKRSENIHKRKTDGEMIAMKRAETQTDKLFTVLYMAKHTVKPKKNYKQSLCLRQSVPVRRIKSDDLKKY